MPNDRLFCTSPFPVRRLRFLSVNPETAENVTPDPSPFSFAFHLSFHFECSVMVILAADSQ